MSAPKTILAEYQRALAAEKALSDRISKLEGATSPPPPPPPPTGLVISNIVAAPTADGAVISWSLSDFGTGFVQYGPTTAYGSETAHENSFTYNAHRQTITGLTAGATIHFRPVSSNAAGVVTNGPDGTFTVTGSVVVPPPPTGAVYGPGVGCDGLANTTVQGSQPNYYRFRAGQSSALSSFLIYIIANGNTGYASGTGGSYRVTVQTVNASGFPTGTVLATTTMKTGNPAKPMWTVTFPSPFTTVAGTLYAFVWENIDSSPESNFWSLDGIYTPRSSPRLPKYADIDWGWGYRNGAGGSWVERSEQVAILDIGYANGQHEGMGYMETSYDSDQGTISGSNWVAEAWTHSGPNRTISTVGLYLWRSGGSSPLVVTLAGATGSIANSAIGTTANGSWATGPLAVTLVTGQKYQLNVSTSAGTTYNLWPIRSGVKEYGYSPATVFGGNALKSSDGGANWSPLGRVPNENDIPFYLR